MKNLQEDDRRPLGPVGLEMLDAIYTPRDDKEIINVEKKPLFAIIISYKIQSKGRLRQAKAKFKKFVDIRNNLVNYFARDYDMAVIESCKKAYDDLKKKYEFIKDVFDFFNSDFQQMMDDLQVIRISLKDKRLRDILNRLYGGQQSANSGRNTHENALPSFGIHFLSFYIGVEVFTRKVVVLAKPHFLSFYIAYFTIAMMRPFWRNLIS